MLYLPGTGEVAISVSAGAEQGGTWDHTIRAAGNVTRTLARLGRGGSLGLRGPYGSAWPLDECRGKDVILIAGGIGLPPLRPVIYELLNARKQFGAITLLYGGRTADCLLYTREYSTWSAGGINIQTTVDRATPGWMGNVGVVPLLLDRLRNLSPSNTVVLICGPEVMLRYTVRSALTRGLQNTQVWASFERNMQCAVGLCGHCQLGPAFICKDGPVFRYDVIAPYLDVEAL
jgi:NAD(P)H-flavin reductase